MIICAAIKITFQRAGKTLTAVIPGYRHSNCWELISAFGIPAEREEVEGFMTSQGAFLDRYDAFNHAMRCGQLSDTTRTAKAEKGERLLYSEDIY